MSCSTGSPYPWEDRFREALIQGDLASAGAAVYSHKGKRRRPGRAEIRRAVELLNQAAADPKGRLSWAVRLFDEGLSTRLAVGLLVKVYADRPSDVGNRVLGLAEDDNWERREDAAWLLRELLASHFEDVYKRCLQWVRGPSANVRRCVAVAVKRAAKSREAGRGERFLDLLEPLLADRTEYVRKNLGPFAIGDGLLRCYPELTVSRLGSWSQRARRPDGMWPWPFPRPRAPSTLMQRCVSSRPWPRMSGASYGGRWPQQCATWAVDTGRRCGLSWKAG